MDLAALAHNLDRAKRLAPGTRVLAVIKSNGYGHGLTRVAHALSQNLSGDEGFAVTNIEEAIALREAGVGQRLLVLTGLSSSGELEEARRHGVDVVVHQEAQIRMLERAGPGPGVRAWLKLDTGMHRLGLMPERARDAWDRLRGCAGVTLPVPLMSHLPKADEREDPGTREQIHGFLSLASALGAAPSIANSAAVLAWPRARTGWIRPGIMLYGISPFPTETTGDPELLPVMTLSTRLMAINRIPKGQAIGYGGTWVCPEDMPVGVAAIGYGDGYPRHAPPGCPVLVNGRRVPLIGRVCMDMITVDLRTQPEARVGDRVVLWGKGLPVEEVAQLSGTIGYELVCGVTPRVESTAG